MRKVKKAPQRGAALSGRESEVMGLLVAGHKEAQISAKLDLAPSTVAGHALRARLKLGAATITEAAVKFAAMKREGGDG